MTSKIDELIALLNKAKVDEGEMVEVFVPFDLKDVLKEKFGVRWDSKLKKNFVKEEYADMFEKTYLDLDVYSHEQRRLCKENGANYDKEQKKYFFIKFQL